MLNLIWKYLLPAMTSELLLDDANSLKLLQSKLQSLNLPFIHGSTTSSIAKKCPKEAAH
ncbi:hypothetical protein [Clostridium oryzae]|uniref:hypothetical protein n=1 Tax=Clostridium oryzae TaxID=1450648 RepID=UPI00147625EF|nr:hypothetical protein [Clostridium oryzae]